MKGHGFLNFSILCRRNFFSFTALLLLGSLSGPQCNHTVPGVAQFPYRINNPDKEYVLEQKLTEVSGLSFISATEVALIQDEIGSIFFFDLKKNKVTKKINFSKKGDYEDLVMLRDTAYALRSDGTLISLANVNGAGGQIVETNLQTGLTAKNNTEGLCYDPFKKLLLIACKGSPYIHKEEKKYKDQKAVYSFNLETKTLSDTPYLLIDVNKVHKMAHGTYASVVEKLIRFYSRAGAVQVFEPSAIAIHPFTRDLYILSSVGKLLVIINPSGDITKVIKLAPAVFKQPEGIGFDPRGNLYITNEGRNGKGNILKFKTQEENSNSLPSL